MCHPIVRAVSFLLLAGLVLSSAASDGGQRNKSPFHASDHYGRLDFSPDGSQLAVGRPNGRIHVWDVKRKQFIRVLRRSEERMLEDLAWNPQGTRLAATDIWSRLSIHDVANEKQLHFLSPRAWKKGAGRNSGNVKSLGWSLAGDSLVLTTTRGFAVWNPNEPGGLKVVVAPESDDDRFAGWHGVISSDGRRLAQVDERGKFRLWDLQTGKITMRSADYKGCQVYLAWSPNNQWVALSSDSTLRILDAQTGATLRDVETPDQSSILAWSPDGKTVAVAQGWLNRWSSSDKPDRKISLVDSHDGTIRHTLNSRLKNIEALAWTPNGKILAVAGSNKVWKLDEMGNPRVVSNPEMPVSLWDADSGKLLDQITPSQEP